MSDSIFSRKLDSVLVISDALLDISGDFDEQSRLSFWWVRFR